jgi:hypothetical protein
LVSRGGNRVRILGEENSEGNTGPKINDVDLLVIGARKAWRDIGQKLHPSITLRLSYQERNQKYRVAYHAWEREKNVKFS